MALDYAEIQADASAAIAEAGMPALLRLRGATGPKYNPTPGAPTDYPCTVVVGSYRLAEVDGSSVLSSDKKVLMAAGGLGIEPSTNLRLVLLGVEHTIVDVQPIRPATVTAAYKLQVRR